MSRKNDPISDLKGGDRLYQLFKKKLEKAPPTNIISRKRPTNAMGMKEELNKELELCITIPLKGIKGGVSIVYRSVTVHLRFDYNKFDCVCVARWNSR